MPWAVRLANAVLPISVYVLALSAMRHVGRTVWLLFPLVFLSAFQIVLLYLYGRSVIAVDMFLNLVTTNAGEAMELLDNLLPVIVFVALIYVPLLVLATISACKHLELPRRFMHRARRVSFAGIILGAICLILLPRKEFTAKNDLYPLNVFYNIKLAVERTRATARYAETSRNFTFKAHPTHNPHERELYVLVIGETARAANFGLYAYPRNTTPRLAAQSGLFVFNKALTQSNTTHKSVPMLLSAVSAENYNNIYRQKGLIAAFKEAGFHTVFLSNQLPNHSFIDFFGRQAHQWRFIKQTAAPNAEEHFDTDLLPIVDSVLAEKRSKQLIVLHTYGSHFEYRKRYPQAMAHFRPDNASEAEPANRPQLLNAYDNTIRYTDSLLAQIIRKIQNTGAAAAVLYTSDHGENIFDDRRHLFLHASPIPSAYELHVPFIIWLSPRYKQLHPNTPAALAANAHRPLATNLATFYTLIHLAGIRTPYFRRQQSAATTDYRPNPYIYLNDHNEAVPLRSILRHQEDARYLRRFSIPF